MNPSLNSSLAPEETYRLYLDGLLTNNRQQCRTIFEQWLEANTGLRTLYENLVRRSLYQVGELWEQGRISVATEHLATAISESLLNLTYPRLFAQPRNGKTAVVTCVTNEYHQIGGKMVADLFELNGWRGYFLGANMPLAPVKALIAEKRPDVVALSLTTVLNLDGLNRTVAEIRADFPAVPIIIGGQALRWLERERLETLPGVRALKTLGELETWVNQNGPGHV